MLRRGLTYVGAGPNLILDGTPDVLDSQHAGGTWSYLEELSEMPRYAVIAGYCVRANAGSVLDLGCGAGILRNWVLRAGAADYTGVDLSNAAIDAARRRHGTDTSFVAGDAALYQPERAYDVIVFNEMLYYFAQPDEVLRRYARFLRPQGFFIASLWDGAESENAWSKASRAVQVKDSVHISNSRGVSWRVRMCKPANP